MLGANPLPSDTLAASNVSEDVQNTSFTEPPLDSNVTLNDFNATGTPDTFVCAFYNPDFIIYSSLGSFASP